MTIIAEKATARLVVVLVSRIQKRGTGDDNFVKKKEYFGTTDRPTGQRGPPSKLVPTIPVRPNRNGPFPFDVPTEICGILG